MSSLAKANQENNDNIEIWASGFLLHMHRGNNL